MEPSFSPKLIIGLGNPGEEYENTFHNVGALFVKWLAENKPFTHKKGKNFEYFLAEDFNLVRTLAFMNESGGAVKEALLFFKVKPDEILLVHDDSDIALGEFKLNWNRGAAGHKGVLSVNKVLKTEEIWRARIGIRTQEKTKAGDFVLRELGKSDLKNLYSSFEGIKVKVMEKINPLGVV